MNKILNKEELLEFISSKRVKDEDIEYLRSIADVMPSGASKSIQVRFQQKVGGSYIKIYVYDRYLYRFMLSNIIALK